jgi:hypothetical protein
MTWLPCSCFYLNCVLLPCSCFYLKSVLWPLELIWVQLNSLELAWTHSIPFEIDWTDLLAFFTWYQLVQLGFTWFYLMSLGCISFDLISIGSYFTRCMWIQSKSRGTHLHSPEFTSTHIAKGKRIKAGHPLLTHFHLAFHRAHARSTHKTKRFVGWAHSSSSI